MVSHHAAWEDTEDGYKNGEIGVFVTPTYVVSKEGVNYARESDTGANANVYSVSFRTGIESGYERRKSLVDFKDPRTAWEYANLATHYIEHANIAEFAVLELQGRGTPTDQNWIPDGVVADMAAEEVMRKMLGRHESQLDDALERVSAAIS
ncbi:hypothetical protein [Natronosalvus rutilus]|uniref:Uncharacterized protein n=1 Tax=Natronosalvus rutilus TaxID=2953753 RepID=A0A9E7NAF3_9EURY|nr:hypothetical protein [Natronosalvus rutilus]UTF53434.1 hypothetical protein NGM29_16955 [Natronosalvus rutilus]